MDILSKLKNLLAKQSKSSSQKEQSKKIDFDWLYHVKEKRWDELNRPIGYIIGVTPGFAQISKSPETYKDLGLMRKYLKGALYGFEFIQLDFETIAEINERYLWNMIEDAKKHQGLEIGIHAPVTGRVAVDLGVALANQWAMHHRSIQRTAYAAGEVVGAKYFLFHSSATPRPNIVFGISPEERAYAQRGQLYSYTGISLGLWIKQLDGKEKTIFEGQPYDYFIDPCYRKIYKPLKDFSFQDYFNARFISVLFEAIGSPLDPDVGLYFYYYDSYEKGLEDAEKLRKEYLDAFVEDIVKDLLKPLEGYQEALKKQISELEEKESLTDDEKNQLEGLKKINEVLTKYLERAHKIKDSEKIGDLILKEEELIYLGETLKKLYPQIEKDYQIPNFFFTEVQSALRDLEQRVAYERNPPKKEGITSQHIRAIKTLFNLKGRSFDPQRIFDYWTTIKGSEAAEEVAYVITAKFMYKYKDYLWQEIVGLRYKTGIDDAYDPDDVILATNLGFKSMAEFYEYREKESNNEQIFKHRLNKYSKAFQKFIYEKEERTPMQIAEDIITAVASKYIQGHLFTKDEWGMDTLPEWRHKIGALKQEGIHLNNDSIFDYAERGGSKTSGPILIFVETEQPHDDSMAGRLRIIRGKHHVILVKSIVEYAAKLLENPGNDIIARPQGPYKDIFAYNIDFEHLSTNLVDPIEDAKSLDDGDGEHIKMLHVNAPRPYGGQHGPLFLLSDEITTLYEWMWILRQKGMKNAYFIWEMGSYGIFQTASVFRRMAIALEHDVAPDELPPEFYGIDETLLAEQKRVLIEHAYEPLEGTLLVPDESHTFLGNATREKGTLDKWKKEELK